MLFWLFVSGNLANQKAMVKSPIFGKIIPSYPMDRWSFYCQACLSGMRSVQVCGMYAFAIWDKKNNTCPLSEADWMFWLPKREECDVPEKRCFLGSLWLWQKIDSLANSAFKSSPLPHIRRSEKTLRGRRHRILIAFFMRMMGWLFLTFHVLFVFCPYFVITKLVRSTRCFHVFLRGLRLGRYVVARDPVGTIPLYIGWRGCTTRPCNGIDQPMVRADMRRWLGYVGLDFFEHHMNLSIS